jgi:histidine triad (HIT) family protein
LKGGVYMSDCIFCQIVEGKIPSYKIYEDDNFLAFLDIFPFTKGHTLVIPKKHYRWVWDVEDALGYMKTCQKIAKHYQNMSKEKLVVSLVFGNEVEHAHIHLLPNLEGDVLQVAGHLAGVSKAKLTEEDAKQLIGKLALPNR